MVAFLLAGSPAAIVFNCSNVVFCAGVRSNSRKHVVGQTVQIGTPVALALAMGLLQCLHVEYVMEGGGTMGEGGETTVEEGEGDLGDVGGIVRFWD